MIWQRGAVQSSDFDDNGQFNENCKYGKNWPKYNFQVICQKLVLRVSSGVPDTEKQMKARGCRPSAFIVSRCLEPLMKHEARVFDMASQTRVRIEWNYFRRIGT